MVEIVTVRRHVHILDWMEFVLTKHAKYALERRSIPLECVEAVLNHPQAVEPDKVDSELEHRLGRVSEYHNRVLRVVVNANVVPARVIIVFWDRRTRGKL